MNQLEAGDPNIRQLEPTERLVESSRGVAATGMRLRPMAAFGSLSLGHTGVIVTHALDGRNSSLHRVGYRPCLEAPTKSTSSVELWIC
jgi:hypothetical protein